GSRLYRYVKITLTTLAALPSEGCRCNSTGKLWGEEPEANGQSVEDPSDLRRVTERFRKPGRNGKQR
ncbi:hypothetical protein, partial [uncultured Ruegeria sp.]|uniref:hypothetical protein n=1 Tax=uncultured Ruegeria sp. TaxID=259304 RepID=UPI00261D143B